MKKLLWMIPLLFLYACGTTQEVGQKEENSELLESITEEEETQDQDKAGQELDQPEEVNGEETEETQQLTNSPATLTEQEVLELIIQAETSAVETFANAMEETIGEIVFQEEFSSLEDKFMPYYTQNIRNDNLLEIYENPDRFYEYGYEFPIGLYEDFSLLEDTVQTFFIDKKDQYDIFIETEIYGTTELFKYSIVEEESVWKVDEKHRYATPENAEILVRFALNLMGSDVEVVYDGSIDLADYVEVILSENLYTIQVYVLNEHSTGTLGWYAVDPRDFSVYEEDLIEGTFNRIH